MTNGSIVRIVIGISNETCAFNFTRGKLAKDVPHVFHITGVKNADIRSTEKCTRKNIDVERFTARHAKIIMSLDNFVV